MPFDEGGRRLTRKEKARLDRARKRAGVSAAKYTPRADTGADKSRVFKPAPIRGESAKEKGRVAVQGRARDIFKQIEVDKPNVNVARQRMAAIQSLGLSNAEKKDFQGYTRAESGRTQERLNPLRRTDVAIGDVVGVRPTDFAWSAKHPKDALIGSDKSVRRGIERGILKESEEFPGSYEPAGVVAGGMMAFPLMGRIPVRVKNLAEREALRAIEKADDPIETIAKRYNKAAKAGDEEQMRVFQVAAEQVRAHTARAAAGKRPTKFDRKVIAQQKKAADAPITIYRGMGMDEYTQWAQSGTKVPAGTRFLKGSEDELEGMADVHKFTVRPEDVIEVKPGVYELVSEQRLGGAGQLRPVVSGHGPTTRGEKIITAANVPRAIKSSFDVSAPFRQGLVLQGANAKLWKQSWVPMMKALRENTGEAERIEQAIRDNPLYDLAKNRLALTDFKGPITKQEENFLGLDYAKHIPGVEASSRAYNTFLNKLRMDFFEFYVKAAMDKGYDVAGTSDESKYLLDSIGKWVNTASGRGGKVDAGKALAAANAAFFSPRLIMSRLQLLNPAQYVPVPGYKGPHPFVRQQARKAMGKLAAEISATLLLAQQAGADVELDPRSSDFGKIKLGDTRIDIAGGMAQFITLYARVLTRQTKTGTGEVVDLEGGYAGRDPWDVVTDFLENKAAPVPGTGVNYLKDESAPGVPFDVKKDIPKLFAPIGVENTIDALVQGEPKAAAATLGLGSVGFGVDTYPQLTKAKPRTAQAKLEAAIAKDIKKQTVAAKKKGLDALPPKVADALTLRAKVEARIKVLTKDQRGAKNARKEFEDDTRFKLTPKQRYAAVINALNEYVPDFNYETAKERKDNLTPEGLAVLQKRYRAYYYGDLLERWNEYVG